VQLAQRMVKCQKESIELQRQLNLCNAEKRQLVIDISEMKNHLLNLHQPQSYLVSSVVAASSIDRLTRIHTFYTMDRSRSSVGKKQNCRSSSGPTSSSKTRSPIYGPSTSK
jgi:hypothetical protein